MRKLTVKWKLFLIANYFLLVLTFLSILTGFYTLSLSTTKTPGAIFIFITLFIFVCIICLFNILIVNRYFPANPLPPNTRKWLAISRITMIVVTFLLGLISAGFISVLVDPAYGTDWATISGIIYFGLLFIMCIYIIVLQFQIRAYLNKQNAGNINQLIDSIGK